MIHAENPTLPVTRVLQEAVCSIWRDKKKLFLLLAFAWLVTSCIDWGFSKVGWEEAVWINLLLRGVVYVILAVRVHRLLLEGHDPAQGFFRWSTREMKFAYWLAFIYCALYVTATIVIIIIGVLMVGALNLEEKNFFEADNWQLILVVLILITTPLAYPFARIAPLLPAIAIDYRTTIRRIWGSTEGNGWRLVLLFWFIPAFSGLPLWNFDPQTPLEILAFNLPCGMLTIWEISILSVVFRHLGSKGSEAKVVT